jgi:alpha-tubulin suppressor-like RCC1 family protein
MQLGKLGLGLVNMKEGKHSEFVQEDLGRQAESYEELGKHNYFTYLPQPIVSLLGTKIRSIETGLYHIMAVASDGQLFAWGDNSHHQLGLDPNNL